MNGTEQITTTPITTEGEAQLNPFPNGWFVVAFSQDVRPGDVRAVRFMNEELVLYRTASGKAQITDAFCPHLGAHLAHGGKVMGEEIQCPFHGFRFNCEGTCTATGYGTKPPPKARLKHWPVDERNGFISVYFDEEGNPPTWFPPTLNRQGWTQYLTAEYELNSHPQETTENIVDMGHFSWVHGYRQLTAESGTTTDGPVLGVHYGFTRNGKEIGRRGDIRVEIRATAYGLGHSYVDTEVPIMGLKVRNFVLPTPIGNGKVKLRLAMAVAELKSSGMVHPLAAIVPRRWLAQIILRTGFKAYCKDVMDDFHIWNNKTYVARPALAKGDGPIGIYRRWARQFYTRQLIG